ncbi:MAG: hypothetical protein V2I67_01970 [Thermoanaerobaculales bacterium]|jgi:hypothetical protein|nr:hypothetical protein [Thermoanaerobaculales bacterium]
MNTATIRRSASLLVILVSAAGAVWGEIVTIRPSQEGHVTVDDDGSSVAFSSIPSAGDSTNGHFLRSLATFDLSFLPPGAEISSAVIHTRIGALYGNPAALGPLTVARVPETRGQPSTDIQTSWATLRLYEDPTPSTGVVAPGEDLSADLSPAFEGVFPSPESSPDPGRAVIRFQFEDDNNGDDTDDFVYFQDTVLELDVRLPEPITERPVNRHAKSCIPVVASLPGAMGTSWTTELHITARYPASVWLYFTETGADGATDFSVRRVDLGMWDTVRYADVLPDLFGLQRTKGWIEVFSTNPGVTINARVANIGGEGSYGQTVPMIGELKLLRYVGPRFDDRYRRLVNLVMMDSDNRTNIGLVNLGPSLASVEVTAMGPDGPFLGHTTVSLGPFEHRQIDRLETVIPQADGAGLIGLSFEMVSDDAPWLDRGVAVYVSRVDNATGDAVFVLP